MAKVGGTLFYTQDGVRFSTPLYPDTIQVTCSLFIVLRSYPCQVIPELNHVLQSLMDDDDPGTS